jgi:hypothetical protein
MQIWRVSIRVAQKLTRDQTSYELLLNALIKKSSCMTASFLIKFTPDSTSASGKEHTDAKGHFNNLYKDDTDDHRGRFITCAGRGC